MGKITVTSYFNSPPEEVFAYMDDIRNIAARMRGMGGKLNLEIISPNEKGVGATYHWTGRILGVPMDFTEEVVLWVENKEKAYKSLVGAQFFRKSSSEARFTFHYTLDVIDNKTRVVTTVEYELPFGRIGRLADRLFVAKYAEKGLGKVYREMKEIIDGK